MDEPVARNRSVIRPPRNTIASDHDDRDAAEDERVLGHGLALLALLEAGKTVFWRYTTSAVITVLPPCWLGGTPPLGVVPICVPPSREAYGWCFASRPSWYSLWV